MAKSLIVLLSVFLLSCNAKQDLSSTQKLHLTAKLWGFLKYYHPKVSEGKFNWDEQLIYIIEKLDDVKTSQELSELYINWIESLGEVPLCSNCKPLKDVEYFDKNFNLSWVNSEMLTSDLTKKLKYIEQNRTQHQYYVSLDGATTLFSNEPTYTTSQWSDENIRLLTLFKYWNVIEYFYPYKYVIDGNWDDLLVYFIPKFKEVKTEQEYHLLINELTVSLCDTHSFFYTDLVRQFSGLNYIPGDIMILDDKAVFYKIYDDSLAKLNDLRLGDAILTVNDEPVSEIYKRNKKYIPGSNEAVKKLNNGYRWILNGNTDSVKISFERMGQIETKTIGRYKYSQFNRPVISEKKWEVINDNIGYVNLEEEVVTVEDLPQMMQDLNYTKAIIFDLRTYPEFMWFELMGYFLSEKKIFAKYIYPDLSYPSRFIWSNGDSIGGSNTAPYKGKLLILMNDETLSRAESFVMAFQCVEGAVTVGRQTAGADGNVADYTFFDDKMSWITGIGVFYPDGRETQRIGIVPDYEVPITLEDIRTGRDAILEKAIEIAKQIK
jgi:carboxyl-terminal processing protease